MPNAHHFRPRPWVALAQRAGARGRHVLITGRGPWVVRVGSGAARGTLDITRRHWSVNIRMFVLSANSLDELVALGTVRLRRRGSLRPLSWLG